MESRQIKTCSQEWAERAYQCISNRGRDESGRGEYCSFAKRFPSLIHACGLAQALAFAVAKKHTGFVGDLETVLGESGLGERSRKAPVPEYLRLSRRALQAAGWLKRYAEALLDSENGGADASLS
ncbi:MAG: type III-B CRISPR module-associated protein Cmr5 [Acidobacteriia bacterium]|nr:type III-B CRISPR module-associated protein Cmr5 [Terriglobia bacterium]